MCLDPSAPRVLVNPRWTLHGDRASPETLRGAPRHFHRSIPGYRETPTRSLPPAIVDHRAARTFVKHEARRFDLPAYKVLGASWALHEAIRRASGVPDGATLTMQAIADAAALVGPRRLCTATDGNHGRGVAWLAAQWGWPCHVFVPHDMVDARRLAIASHGAHVTRVEGGYDAACDAAEAAQRADPSAWLCADTARDDEAAFVQRFAADVQRGYHTLFEEATEQVPAAAIDCVLVPTGVGALAASAVTFFREYAPHVRVITVEPEGSACVQAALERGRPMPVSDSPSIMAGLRAGVVSSVAWPTLRSGVAAAVSITDDEARDAMVRLGGEQLEAGESGAASLAGARRLLADATACAALGVTPDCTVLLINTEGATDPAAWARVLASARP
ncbi:MAG: pyridoxal-phosphate dependent enzyme [Gemmatimonadaceae bacterium]|jgi:diaminopropionate ammonia-lyase|nr:pyridoxal-phosphate dependent enzyme [Gemmatimonadaceae bacterium]